MSSVSSLSDVTDFLTSLCVQVLGLMPQQPNVKCECIEHVQKYIIMH